MALYAELARVVVRLADQEHLRSFSLPYPRRAQLALDRTGLHCLSRGLPPPKSVPELIEWCRDIPAGEPPFDVPPAFLSPETTLVDVVGAMPSRSCLELASWGPHGLVEQEAARLLAELAARSGPGGNYHRCRLFLSRRPVITQHHRFMRRSWNPADWTRVKELYQPVPASLRADGELRLCGTCGLPHRSKPRKAHEDPLVWCEQENCPPEVPVTTLHDPGRAVILRRSLRAFVVVPQKTEQAALEALTDAGVPHEFTTTGLGGYLVRDGADRIWHMQAHDRRQPTLLAARVRETRAQHNGPVLVVVPDSAWNAPGYRAAFNASMSAEGHQDIVLTNPAGLVGRLAGTQNSCKETEPVDA